MKAANTKESEAAAAQRKEAPSDASEGKSEAAAAKTADDGRLEATAAKVKEAPAEAAAGVPAAAVAAAAASTEESTSERKTKTNRFWPSLKKKSNQQRRQKAHPRGKQKYQEVHQGQKRTERHEEI